MPLSNYFKKNWKNYLLLLCTIAVFLVGFEIFTHLYAYVTEPIPTSLFEKDECAGFKLKAGYTGKAKIGKSFFGDRYNVKINSKGLRDHEFSYKNPENTFRILLLGDSFTFGVKVELNETFPKLLENELNYKYKSRNYEVINAGVPAWGTINELCYLKEEGLKYNPDLIVLAFFYNDIMDNADETLMLAKTLALTNSCSFRSIDFIKERVNTIANKLKNPDYSQEMPIIDLSMFSKDFSKEDEGKWRLTKKYLKEMNSLSKKQNTSLVLVTIPSYEQILLNHTINLEKLNFKLSDEKQYSKIRPNKNNLVDLVDYLDFGKPNKLLKNFTKKENIVFIDLLPEFKNYKGNLFLLPEDDHYNKEGNKLVANTLYDELINRNLIPTK